MPWRQWAGRSRSIALLYTVFLARCGSVVTYFVFMCLCYTVDIWNNYYFFKCVHDNEKSTKTPLRLDWRQFSSPALITCHIYLHLLTPWCRVLPEQLPCLQLIKKFPAFHGTRRFITALTSVRHVFLFWATAIQSTCPHPTSWRSILPP